MKPKKLTSDEDRAMARRERDFHWSILERIAKHDPLWICWWDKDRRHSERNPYKKETRTLPDDLLVLGLIGGSNEFLSWVGPNGQHPDWLEIGEWSDERYAAPVRLTDAGRAALADRDKYDMEPVHGGLVEPGFVCIPSERAP